MLIVAVSLAVAVVLAVAFRVLYDHSQTFFMFCNAVEEQFRRKERTQTSIVSNPPKTRSATVR